MIFDQLTYLRSTYLLTLHIITVVVTKIWKFLVRSHRMIMRMKVSEIASPDSDESGLAIRSNDSRNVGDSSHRLESTTRDRCKRDQRQNNMTENLILYIEEQFKLHDCKD